MHVFHKNWLIISLDEVSEVSSQCPAYLCQANLIGTFSGIA
jgi:hypothetical protein